MTWSKWPGEISSTWIKYLFDAVVMPFQKQVCFLFTGCFWVRTEKLLNSPFIHVPLFSFVVRLGKAALDTGFCWCAEYLDRCPIPPGARSYTIWTIRGLICISGHQFQGRRCFWDGNHDLRMWPSLCREMKGGCLDKKENRKFTKSAWALVKSGALSSPSSTTPTECRCYVIKGCKIMQQKWGYSGGLGLLPCACF